MMTQTQSVINPASRGFTLIEAIVYFALLGAIITGILVSSYPLFTNTERSSAAVLRDLESALVFRSATYLLNRAVHIEAPSPGNSGSSLRIRDREGDTYELSLSGTEVMLSVNGGSALPLTASRVEITGFTVTHAIHTIAIDFNANDIVQGPYLYHVRF
ncbi:MAG: prepilin-type N-terminal cleavage/methylation domain-containing protein [Minisyncoccia bacterium]